VNFENHAFIAWNPKFLEYTGCSDDELRAIKLENVLTLGESWSPVSGEEENTGVEYTACTTKHYSSENSSPGFVVKNRGRIGYVMLDSFGSSAQFEQGKTTGREEERNRIAKAFHDEVSSSMLAALFLVEAAKTQLEDARLPQAKLVAEASDILAETTEKIVAVVTNEAGA
jgi:signal transduction histidine kinase